MFLQGHLQKVFDALYEVGAIDPVLNADWSQITERMATRPNHVRRIFQEVNSCSGDLNTLVHCLHQLDQESLNYLAMEVARELAEYEDRQTIH